MRQMTLSSGFVVVLFLGLLALAGCGGGGDGGSVVLSSGTSVSQLYVSGGNELLVFGNANTASGVTAPNHTVSGGLTTLNGPRGIAVDMARNQIYAANYVNNAIVVFNNGRTASGDIAPDRTIAGSATTLNGPSSLFFDVFNNRLYVANTGDNSILVFDNASTANGEVLPTRTLMGGTTTLNAPSGVFVDITRNKLYVINSGANSILVFDNATMVSGDTVPTRTISGALTGMSSPSGGALDMLQDRLYVANTGSDSILVYNAISTISGNKAPDRMLAGVRTTLNQPRDLFLDLASDRMYVANTGDDSILVFNSAGNATGSAAPDRTLMLTSGIAPYGVFVDVTPVVVGSSDFLDGEAGSDLSAVSAGGAPRTGDIESYPASTAYRQFYSFDLAKIPANTTVAAATLRLYQASVTGSPYDGGLRSVVVDHVNYGTSLEGTDYAGSALLGNVGILSSNDSVGYKTLAVASRVQDDLANGRLRTQYRLRFSLSDANLNGNDDYVRFTDAEDSCCNANRPPQLMISFRP